MAQKVLCEVVTAERIVFSGEADMVLAPGAEGQLGILPRHAPLLAALQEGELIIRGIGGSPEEDVSMAIGGGFIEVLDNRVVVLADSAERAEEIDEDRAEEARQNALEQLQSHEQTLDLASAEAALRRSKVRLKVSKRRRSKRGRSPRPDDTSGQ
jgi:F-type H+-transporting ATPase subunit epsilon